MVTSDRYFIGLMQYIWMNRYKVTGQKPNFDRYCSACWRLFPHVIKSFITKKSSGSILSKFLDDYPEHLFAKNKTKLLRRSITNLVNQAIENLAPLDQGIFENSHTIGDKITVAYRGEYLSAFARERVP